MATNFGKFDLGFEFICNIAQLMAVVNNDFDMIFLLEIYSFKLIQDQKITVLFFLISFFSFSVRSSIGVNL